MSQLNVFYFLTTAVTVNLMKIQQTSMIQFMMMYSGALHVLAMFAVYMFTVGFVSKYYLFTKQPFYK